MASALERAARALFDAVNVNCEDAELLAEIWDATKLEYLACARAVLMAVREQWLEIYHASEGKPLPTYEQAEGFPDMIDAILNEKDTTND